MIRVANAPCSWGILDFAGGAEAPGFATVLDEIRAAGYAGTELGHWGFMPADPSRLGAELAARQLQLVGAVVPIALAEASAHGPGLATALKTATLMRDAGAAGACIVLSDHNGAIPEREQQAGRIRAEHGLPDEDWSTFAAGAEQVAHAVREETGLPTVFHPHCGGYVETADEIDELMRRTDPSRLGLVLDTGHLLYGGGDPLEVFQAYRERVRHVYFKDCDLAVAKAVRAQELGYLAAVRSQLFCELGSGAVDFAAMTRALTGSGYDGWIVVEQEVFPGYGTPTESARKNREYLRALGL